MTSQELKLYRQLEENYLDSGKELKILRKTGLVLLRNYNDHSFHFLGVFLVPFPSS